MVFRLWTSHVHELLLCCSLQSQPLSAVIQGAITYKEQPTVLPRSVAQLRETESGLVRRLVLESLEQHLFPSEAMQHCKKLADPFVTRSESMMNHMIRLAHFNSARRFRRLAHVFPDFNELQHEAWELDEALKATFGANLPYPKPCWVWIMDQALQAIISKLLLGCSLEVYDEAELHMIYWYVDYLYGLRIYNLNELHCAKEASGSKKKAGGKQPKDQPGSGRPRNPPASFVLLESTQLAVRGLFRVLAFCLRQRLLLSPPASEAGLAQRFILRFRSLELFRLPHLPSFVDFKLSASLAQEPIEGRSVLTAAKNSFAEALTLLGKFASVAKDSETSSKTTNETKALKRVIVANQLAVTQLLRVLDAGEDLSKHKVVVEHLHHPNFASLQVCAR